MKLTEITPKEFCEATNACSAGREFALKYQSMNEVWDNCPTANWLLWIINKTGRLDDQTLRLFAVWCARNTPLPDGRKTGDLLIDPQSLAALDVAERFANGQLIGEELVAAWSAAKPAAWDTAGAAARAAAWSSAWSAALAASGAAARAAAGDIAGDAWGDAAWDALGDAALDAQATQFRAMVKNPFTQ
jgi:hypothetical protein